MDKQRARQSASIPVRIGHAAAWAAGLWKQEHLRTLITGVQRFVLCAVLAQGTILGGYMPFGLAMTAALMARGAGLSALGGLVCGVMLRGDGFHGGIYAAAALLVLCVMSVCAGLRVMSERWFAPGVATFASAACTFVFLPLGAELTAPAVLTFLLVQGITFGVCWMYGAAFAPPRDENDWRRPVTLLVLTATVLLSLSGINLFGVFAPARAGALLLVLAAAYLGGPAAGAAAGVAFGAAMDLNIGYGALFTCCYGLCALVAGLFHDSGRGWFSVCALGGGLCAAMLGVEHPLFIPLIAELFCAVLMFAALPPFVWEAIRRSLLPDTLMGEAASQRVRRLAGTCATEAAQAFYELYLAMLHGVSEGKAAGDRNIRAVFDYASDHVCKNCMLCTQCWQRDYVSTLAALNDVTQPMLQRGRAEMSDFPYHFAARCARLPELMRAINSALFALRERESLRRQQEENQSLLARQYAGITDILRQLGAEVTQDETAQPLMERQVRRYAAAFGWIDRVGAVPCGGRHWPSAEGGRVGLGRQRVLLSHRHRNGVPAPVGRHGFGCRRVAAQPHAHHLARAVPACRHFGRRCAARGLSGAAPAVGRHALHHTGRIHARSVQRTRGKPQVRRRTDLHAAERSVDHSAGHGAAHRSGRGGRTWRCRAAADERRRYRGSALGRRDRRHG